MPNPLKPEVRLLAKLASIVVHADEMLSSDGHRFDKIALQSALTDPEINEWLAAMGDMAFIPKKRKAHKDKGCYRRNR